MSEQQEYIQQLAAGIKVEQEHKPTYNKIKKYVDSKGKMPSMYQFARWTAMDHLKESDDYYEELDKMEKKLKKEGSMEKLSFWQSFAYEIQKLAVEATKPVKATPAKPTAKPANASKKPMGEGGAGEGGTGQKIDPLTGKPVFEGVKFQAGLKTEKDETKVMVSTTKPKADLGFKELASTFINKVNIGDAKGKK